MEPEWIDVDDLRWFELYPEYDMADWVDYNPVATFGKYGTVVDGYCDEVSIGFVWADMDGFHGRASTGCSMLIYDDWMILYKMALSGNRMAIDAILRYGMVDEGFRTHTAYGYDYCGWDLNVDWDMQDAFRQHGASVVGRDVFHEEPLEVLDVDELDKKEWVTTQLNVVAKRFPCIWWYSGTGTILLCVPVDEVNFLEIQVPIDWITMNQLEDDDEYCGHKVCPECMSVMEEVDTIVESDECPYGPEENGDFELGTCATRIWKCPSCGHEVAEDLGFEGSGVLR